MTQHRHQHRSCNRQKRERHHPRIATALGFGAVLLWSTLASLTSLKGTDIPPFQTTAITFLIGGITIAAIAILSGRAAAMVADTGLARRSASMACSSSTFSISRR